LRPPLTSNVRHHRSNLRMQTVRLSTPTDAKAVSALVLSLVDDMLVDPEGEEAQRFYASMSPNEVTKYMEMPTRFYVVAEVDGQVQGMIMVRNDNYIGQFFVSHAHQGKGLGSALWQFALTHARQLGGAGQFTVNSSLAAVPVYKRFGFVALGAPEVASGFKFIPMRRGTSGAA
jgi:GNAT superfamily N-acetyltransferase